MQTSPLPNVRRWPARRVAVLFGLSVALLACGYLAAGGAVFSVRIPESRMNDMVHAKLPLQRTIGPVAWRIDTATLKVLGQGRIGFEASVHGAVGARGVDAHIAGSGVLRYRDGAFWMSDVQSGALDHVVFGSDAAPEKHPTTLKRAWADILGHNARLNAAFGGAGDALITEVLKHAGDMIDTIFARIPVYRLPDDIKGRTAKLVLLSVDTDGQDLVAHVDPAGGVLRVVAAAAAASILLYGAAFVSMIGLGLSRTLSARLFFWW